MMFSRSSTFGSAVVAMGQFALYYWRAVVHRDGQPADFQPACWKAAQVREESPGAGKRPLRNLPAC